MDAPLYDVYLTGKLADDVTPALAAQRLAALFKSTPAAMAGLIAGKAQLLKRGVDKNTALKYRDALQNAGCEVVFKAQTTVVAGEKPATTTQPTPTAAAISQSTQPTLTSATSSSGLQLAPMGEDLLRPNERHAAATVVVDTTHLTLAPAGPLPAIVAAPAAAPDTSHLSLIATDSNLLAESERGIPPAIEPDITGLSLAEPGVLLETLKSEVTPLQPDTSEFQLAPVGSDLLTPEQRQHPQPAPPKTDHITLAP